MIPSDDSSTILSESPSMKPSVQPTVQEHFVGDYKISAQNSSHGSWLLCDGSFIDSTYYSELFDSIGYSFGSVSGNSSLFQLPNVSDHVIGMSGNLNSIGNVVGTEEVTLTEGNLPSHWHYIAQRSNCNGDYSETTHYYLADACHDDTFIGADNFYYVLHPNDNPPNRYTELTCL